MAEDIIEEKEGEDVEWVVDETTTSEYINTFCYVLATMEGMNVMTREDREVIDSIKEKSMRIVKKFVDETYFELFDD
jgi:hypothetical protein